MTFLLLLTTFWLALVVVRFRASRTIPIIGLIITGAAAFGLIASGGLTPRDLGLVVPRHWIPTLGLAIAWLALMLLYTPLADRIATRFFTKPPMLEMFRALQESRVKLVAGIVFAWIFGGFLEELALRAIVFNAVEGLLTPLMLPVLAGAVGIMAAAAGAFVIHLYQGLRAAFIVTQLSVLFGIVFVVGGGNLWTVVLCHGLYDTVAFVRFANRSSKYSNLDPPGTPFA